MFRYQRFVNLDNNATTDVSRPVRKRVDGVLRRCHGNPSAAYGLARAAATVLQDSRELVASAIGAESDEVYFTGSASEANNQVLKASCELRPPGSNRILTTPIEHPSIMHTLEYLAEGGVEVVTAPVDDRGRVSVEGLEVLIDERTFLICCMLANNEVGTIQDVRAVAALGRRRQIPVLSDCVQALGKIPVDVRALGVDYATFSAHKLHGPKGVGALYVRCESPMLPLLHGGGQEAGMRAGTEGLHSIAGFAEACRQLPELLARSDTISARRDSLLAALREMRPDLVVHSPAERCLPNTLSLRFPGARNADLMAALDMNGVAVAAGSACGTKENTASHVLLAIGLTDEEAGETIRISLSDETSERDLRHATRAFRDYFEHRTASIPLLRPSCVDEAFLCDEQNYLLDIRFEIERKLMKGLPNSYNASVVSFGRYVHQIPKDKNVIVVCSTGIDATPIAYSLHKRGYRRVSILLGGVVGWQIQHPKLYKRFGNQNIKKLTPRR